MFSLGWRRHFQLCRGLLSFNWFLFCFCVVHHWWRFLYRFLLFWICFLCVIFLRSCFFFIFLRVFLLSVILLNVIFFSFVFLSFFLFGRIFFRFIFLCIISLCCIRVDRIFLFDNFFKCFWFSVWYTVFTRSWFLLLWLFV